MTPEIVVGNAPADALAKKGASVFPAVQNGPDHLGSTATHLCHQLLAAQAAPRSASAHLEDVLLAARRVRKRERTILSRTLHRTHRFPFP